jgi:DNA-binding transcriptional regulator PaaX
MVGKKAVATWLILIYKIPREPSAPRVAAWRKLKQLGAVMLQDAVWVLPATAWTREQFQWLAAEIAEAPGEVLLWEACSLPPTQEDRLIAQFTAVTEEHYQALLAALQQPAAPLATLAGQYQQIQRQDYFQSPLGPQVHAALLAAREGATV